MDNSFSNLIDSATSVLVLLPTKPYFDQVAAGLSLYLSIHDKKEVAISCPSPMMVGFNRIIGVDKISTELGNKNLTIKFKDYDAENIEKVSYDIINGEFNLTVAPKTGLSAPQREQLNLSYAGVVADVVILIGGANDSHFPLLESKDLGSAKIVHIGNRTLSSNLGVISFAKPGSTTSELVANLIKNNNLSVDPDIATNLIMGIEEGSSNFSSNEVTPETFETFAWLLRNGGQRQPKTKLSPMSFPPGAIPTQPLNKPVQTVQQNPVQQFQVASQPVSQALLQPVTPPTIDASGTQETEQDINPPDDWLQPKIFKGSNPPMGQSDSFSENKG